MTDVCMLKLQLEHQTSWPHKVDMPNLGIDLKWTSILE